MRPCLNCNDRVVGCHGKCEKYKSYRDKIDKIHKENRKNTDINLYIFQRNRRINKKCAKN